MLSAVIIAKNEEKNLGPCLDSLSFTNELILFDNGSTDGTKEIAEKAGARAIDARGESNFSTLRNRGLREAKGEWVLFIDADERVSEKLRNDIVKKILTTKNTSFYLKRRDHWWGRALRFGEVFRAYHFGIIRLVKKNSGNWHGAVHEEFVPNGPVGSLSGFIEHYPHPKLTDFIDSINTYSSLRARELDEKGQSAKIYEIVLFPLGKFFYTYFLFLGFLDGAPGFVYSLLMSWHSYLTRSKLYMMKK